MNTNTLCNKLAERARIIAAWEYPQWKKHDSGRFTVRSEYVDYCSLLANRIIAERTREQAAHLRAQMPEPGYNTDGTRQTVTYDGLTRDEWIARELGVTVREVSP